MIPIADLLEWLGSPTGVDDLISDLEIRAVDIVEQETERYFGPTKAITEFFDGNGDVVLYLNERPSSITSVEERLFVGDPWTTITEGDSDGFELRAPQSESAGSQLHRKGGLVWRLGYEYRVVYNFGYVAGNEPDEIRQAVFDLVALKYSERERSGLRSETIGDYSYTTLADGMGRRDLFAIPGLMRTLGRWRKATRTFA